jgi:Domain of unknown function (DUF4345)
MASLLSKTMSMKIKNWMIRIFLCLLGLATLNIAVKAMIDPQAIFDLVDVTLGNTTARNSVRALYGGVNVAFGLYWLYAAFRAQQTGLVLALLYTGGFAVGRLLSIFMDGMPGSFAMQWLVTESVFAVVAAALLWTGQKQQQSIAQ